MKKKLFITVVPQSKAKVSTTKSRDSAKIQSEQAREIELLREELRKAQLKLESSTKESEKAELVRNKLKHSESIKNKGNFSKITSF